MDDPKNVVACFEFAHALFACGEFSKAARMIVHGIGRYPEWSGVSMDRREYYAKDRRDDFFRQLERLRDECLKAPDDPSLAYLLGYCLYFTARRAEAEKAFRKAKVSGWIGEADYFLATLRGRGGTVPEAGKPTPPKPKNSIDTWLTNLGRGKKAFDAREYDASAREYAKALKVRPEAHMVRFELARSLFAAARYADAEKEVRAGLSSLPQSQRDQIPWMNAYADKALFQEHLTALEARCRKGGGSIFLLAFSLFYSGNFQRAAEEFEKVFILNSSDRQAIYYFKLIDKLGKKK
jgi:tetratricopeptide (TPR) repeat protein